MTDDGYRELTEKHEHALERIAAYERSQRKSKNWIITAILAALGTAGSSGGLAYMDGLGDDSMQTVVASHVAVDSQWKENADTDLENLLQQQQLLRDAVIRLQVTVENLSEKHRVGDGVRERLTEVSELLNEIEGSAPKKSKPRPVDVQKVKRELFNH